MQSLDLPQAWRADQWGGEPTLLQTHIAADPHLHSLPAASQPASGPCQSWRRRGTSAVATDSAPRRCLIGVGDTRGTCPPWSRCTKRGRPVRPVRPRWPAVPGTGRHTTPHSQRCRRTQSAVFHSSCRWADPAPRPSWQSQPSKAWSRSRTAASPPKKNVWGS